MLNFLPRLGRGVPCALALIMSLPLAACDTAFDTFELPTGTADTYLQITATGAGPLDQATAYGAKPIAAKLPGYTTDSLLIGLERLTATAVVVFRDANGGRAQVLHVVPGASGGIGEIHGVSRHVIGPAHERPGMTLREARVDPKSCRPGEGLWLGLAVCRSSGAANVALTFSFKGEPPATPTLPDAATLAEGELQRIIWTPPPTPTPTPAVAKAPAL